MTNDEVLAIIQQTELDGSTELDLFSQELEELPSEIGNLINLTSLDLGNNQLTALPPEIGNLVNIIYLDLQNNELTALPPGLNEMLEKEVLIVTGNRPPLWDPETE